MTQEEKAKKILRAITDVDDAYLTAALSSTEDGAAAEPQTQQTQPEQQNRKSPDKKTDRKRANRVLVFRRRVQIIAALAACTVVALISSRMFGILRDNSVSSSGTESAPQSTADAGAAGTAAADTSETATEAGQNAPAAADATADQDSLASNETEDNATAEAIANPYQQVESLAEAEAITGFSLTVPAAEAPYSQMVIYVIDGTTTQVSYTTADGADTGYEIRKAAGSDDISGDYNEYAAVKEAAAEDVTITIKGYDEAADRWSLAVWTSNGFTYAIEAQNHPLTEEEMVRLAAATQ